MSKHENPRGIHLPRGWPRRVKSAIVNVIALAQYAAAYMPISRRLHLRDHGPRESLRASETAQALRMNLVREPDAGDPHVRFDERDVETENGRASEAPANERAGNR